MTIPENVPAIATDQQDEEKINFLIGGKNGSLMDTMIVAQVDIPAQKVKLISVPRDLYFNGRKHNSYSTEQILQNLGVITGLHIDHYMIVDMYAYIDVVDILGGIDIYLRDPVVDPNYKTFDNGVWGTLNYSTGWHHLSGVQSLRLARSRQTSSDFVRAERQQDILKAVKEKANSLNINNGADVLRIASSILGYLNTDLSLRDSVTYYFRFKNFDVEPRGVLSTGNILTSEMRVPGVSRIVEQQCEVQKNNSNESVPVKCNIQAPAQYILIPRAGEGQWNTVRWYVAELLKD